MKTIYRYLIILILAVNAALLPSSCEEFLDVQPTSSLVADNAIYDAKTARASIISVYSSAKSYSTGSAVTLGVIPGDNVFFGGSQSQNIELDANAFTVTNSAIVGAYRENYTIINRANWVLSEVPKVTDEALTDEERNHLIGEAYFLRAFAYFHLARSWGGVQIQLQPTTDLSSIGNIKRSSQEETYARVIEDLDEAERLLRPDDNTTRNRAQKAIVQAFRARVHLYARQWDEAERYATQVIDNPKYELVSPYRAFFTAPFLTKEAVFEFTSTATDRNTSWSAWYPSAVTRSGSYERRPTSELINLLNDPEKGGTRNVLIAQSGSDVYGVLYNTVSTTTVAAASTDPAYVIRLADLYLIRAEARARKTPANLPEAVSDLNRIRNRAEVASFPETGDANAVLLAIEEERRLEFAFEAHRWYDLVRTERAKDILGVDRNFWLFPIPRADVLSDPDLDGHNNPGYD
ncbi:MAG: RagB/SusD family nutrient uptake outer membrane protein [Prevotellaceae bacterium]|jgi:hypothetical protein|nr:RagB/SusD family nutrient uptake outer membrane protein [Prevotellaceae bacterium]